MKPLAFLALAGAVLAPIAYVAAQPATVRACVVNEASDVTPQRVRVVEQLPGSNNLLPRPWAMLTPGQRHCETMRATAPLFFEAELSRRGGGWRENCWVIAGAGRDATLILTGTASGPSCQLRH